VLRYGAVQLGGEVLLRGTAGRQGSSGVGVLRGYPVRQGEADLLQRQIAGYWNERAMGES